jgi:hypothetical protein
MNKKTKVVTTGRGFFIRLSYCVFFPVLLLALLGAKDVIAQSNPSQAPFYSVLSSDSHELVVRITPQFTRSTVIDSKTGEEYTRFRFLGGTTDELPVGSAATEWLALPFLMPTSASASVEIISRKTEMIAGISLAPVPTFSFKKGQPVEIYAKDASLYLALPNLREIETRTSGTFRTAYTGVLRVYPLHYNTDTKTITIVREIVVRIHFNATKIESTSTPSLESAFFRSAFINGNVSEFYRNAKDEVAPARLNAPAYKQTPLGAGNEKWISVKTTEEGIYRITAADLAGLGITGVNPNTISLYGYGGIPLPEAVDSTTGELKEVTMDVRSDGSGNFQEARFFAPGIAEWRYRFEPTNGKLFNLYHINNPYTSTGRFLLKIGGAVNGKRVQTKADDLTASPLAKTSVFTVSTYEKDERFEFPSISREFLGEVIPLERDLTISLPNLPGYLPDSTIIRPAVNSKAYEAHTFSVKANNTQIGTFTGGTLYSTDDPHYSARNWASELKVPASAGMPQNITLSVTTNEQGPSFWLNWIETFYLRKTSLSDGQVPFLVFSDKNAYSYTFTDASDGEVWDVSDPLSARRLASASGSTLQVAVQGRDSVLRRFIGFSNGNLRSPDLSSVSAPSLRPGLCQIGVQDIIIAPEEFLDAANRLADLRRKGGQATEPLSVAVVTLEDIYREFGYGSHDVSSIRDFLSYTLRHTAANGTTIPLFVTLFGNGHADYQNRMTSQSVTVPIYETSDLGSVYLYRKSQPENVPDDAFFVRLTPSSEKMDVAIGRVTVHTADEADNFVRKVEKYETGSDDGLWRARTTILCDDRYYEDIQHPDGIDHMSDAENEVAGVDSRLIIDKLYSHSYPYVTIAGGQRRKPELSNAIVDAINSGSVVFSFVGHGNPNVWTNEYVLSVPSTINKLTNFNKLTFLATATCDFSTYDNYAEPISGGVMMITKPDGGAVASLGTSRSVYPGEELVFTFFRTLFTIGCDEGQGSNHIGFAYVAGRGASQNTFNRNKFYILGDPAQRLLIARQYVVIDSINGKPYNKDGAPLEIPSLSQVRISGYISSTCDGENFDPTFNGSTSVSLFDAPTLVQQTTIFTESPSITDMWYVEGPILYRGSATVKNGRFSTTFLVPKDIKFDTNSAKLHMLAYSDDFRSALGIAKNIKVFGTDTSRAHDTQGPKLTVFIGSRRFHSGDVVPTHSKVIVDVEDVSGINTSTASIGHSFIGWANDSTDNIIDFAQSYIAKQDDYTAGTSEQQTILPKGKGVMHVRAFDALNNPAFAEVDFVANDEEPYQLYDFNITPNPARSYTTFNFLQPSAPESPVDVTVTIYSIDGRKIRDLEQNNISNNDVSVSWDLTDGSGSKVPDAAYIYRATVRERNSDKGTVTGGVFIVQKQ